MKNIRHGDLALIGIDKLPEGLSETKSNILMKGNNGHDHTFDKGNLYITGDSFNLPEGEFIFGYFQAKNSTLSHEDHGDILNGNTRQVKIPDGIYSLNKQVEYTSEGMRAVQD